MADKLVDSLDPRRDACPGLRGTFHHFKAGARRVNISHGDFTLESGGIGQVDLCDHREIRCVEDGRISIHAAWFIHAPARESVPVYTNPDIMYTWKKEDPMGASTSVRHKHLRIDQAKLDKARKVLAAATETETLDRALSLVVSEAGVDATLRHVAGKGRLKKLFR